jgi:hypothetical protein
MFQWGEFVEWIFTLLSLIPSPPVEHVSLAILYSCDIDWARLDRLLTQQRWANLQRFSVEDKYGMQGTMEFIRSRLPVLESRGVLDLVG